MKNTLAVSAFFAAILIALPLFALAYPITGINILLPSSPDAISRTTNSAGVAVFQNVKPGKHQLTIGSINWGDGTQKSTSKKSTVVIQISVPGQPKVESTFTYNGPAKTTGQRFAPFSVLGTKLQTVTVTIFDRWGNL
jgi:hypothetical protein